MQIPHYGAIDGRERTTRMLSLRSRNNSTTSRENKELQKLKRQDLLELLIEQMQENDALRASISEAEIQIRELTSLSERLKDKLNDKDAQIELLKDRLNDKDAQIDTFKARLDAKDKLLEGLYTQARTMVNEDDESRRMVAMLEVEDLMASHYMHRAGQDADEAEGVEEVEAEDNVEADDDVEAEDADDAEVEEADGAEATDEVEAEDADAEETTDDAEVEDTADAEAADEADAEAEDAVEATDEVAAEAENDKDAEPNAQPIES